MATSEPPLLSNSPSSIEDVIRWVNHIPKTMQDHLACSTTLPICILKLPETQISDKPDAYIPQQTGLGPIHHFRRDLYKKEQLKLVTAEQVLKPYNITSEYEKIVQDRLKDLVTVARSCYNLNFDIGNNPLAWVFAIDSLVLLDILSKVSEGKPSESLEDVMKLENQIPLVMVIELLNALKLQLSGELESQSSYLTNLLLKFCETRSPLKFSLLNDSFDLDLSHRFHLLDCMYHLKVCHAKPPLRPSLPTDYSVDIPSDEEETHGIGINTVIDAFLQPFKDALGLPWDKINFLIKKMLGWIPTKLEVVIPSVSHLVRLAKIEFVASTGGIRDIEFDEEKLTFCVPVLDMKSDSEVILRNLVAYEESMFKNGHVPTLDITEYVDFTCGIVDSDKDVKILREKNIILGDMEDKEIVKVFNGITKSSGKVDGMRSKLKHAIEKVNHHYGNVPRVKIYYTIKNVLLMSWKIILVSLAILGLLVMIYIGVREVSYLKDLFTVSNVLLVIPHASSNNELLAL